MRPFATPAPHLDDLHPAPPGQRTYRTDASRCTPGSRQKLHESGYNPESLRSPSLAFAYCTADKPDHRSSNSACVASGCRHWSPCCAAGERPRPGSTAPASDSALRTSGWSAVSALRASAPRRSPPSGSSSIFARASAVDIHQVCRHLDLLLHQVDQVGAAGQELCCAAPIALTAPSGSLARWYSNGCTGISFLPAGLRCLHAPL